MVVSGNSLTTSRSTGSLGTKSEKGKAESVSTYPKLTVYLEPQFKERVDALCFLEEKPAWQIINDAVEMYIKGLSHSDRTAVEDVVGSRQKRKDRLAESESHDPGLAKKAGD